MVSPRRCCSFVRFGNTPSDSNDRLIPQAAREQLYHSCSVVLGLRLGEINPEMEEIDRGMLFRFPVRTIGVCRGETDALCEIGLFLTMATTARGSVGIGDGFSPLERMGFQVGADGFGNPIADRSTLATGAADFTGGNVDRRHL